MSLTRPVPFKWMLGVVLTLSCASARADQIWDVSLDTSHLSGYTGPFGLDFELVGTLGNTVTLSNFAFGAGGSAGPGGPFSPVGGATGDLGSSVIFTDSPVNSFIDFNQQFTPGSTLTFTMHTTVISSMSMVDNFSMVIFSSYDPINGYNPLATPPTGGNPVPTNDTSSGTVYNLDLGSTTPNLYGYNDVNGATIPIYVTLQASVPEPASGVLMLVGVIGTAAAFCRRRNSRS